MRLDLTARAEADIRKIFVYGLETHGQVAADRYLEHLNDSFHRLTLFPLLGHIDENAGRPYRVLVVGDHRVFYRVVGDTVRVIRVFHQRANPAVIEN